MLSRFTPAPLSLLVSTKESKSKTPSHTSVPKGHILISCLIFTVKVTVRNNKHVTVVGRRSLIIARLNTWRSGTGTKCQQLISSLSQLRVCHFAFGLWLYASAAQLCTSSRPLATTHYIVLITVNVTFWNYSLLRYWWWKY